MNDNYQQDDLTTGTRSSLSKIGKSAVSYLAKKGLLTKVLLFVVLFIVFVALIFASGVSAVSSAVTLFEKVKEFLGDDADESITVYGQASDLLQLIDEGFVPDEEVLSQMQLDMDTFLYLLELTDSYNSHAKATRTITITGIRHYLERETAPTTDSDPNALFTESADTSVSVKSGTDHPTLTIEVSNANTEGMLFLDWRRLYFYSLFASMENNSPDDSGIITTKNIDLAYRSISMHYDYAFNIMTDTKDYYTYEECQKLPHTVSVSGDPDTEAGETTFYYPTSLMNYAYSGHSRLVYAVDESMQITGIEEHYDPTLLEASGFALSQYYDRELIDSYCAIIPGGDAIKEQFDYYDASYEQGNSLIYRSSFSHSLGNYHLAPESYDLRAVLPEGGGSIILPSIGLLPESNGLIFDGEVLYKYPMTVGEAAVNLALSRLNWVYSQERRMANGAWDCSSMIGRIYNELGLNIDPYIDTMGLQMFAKEHNQIVALEDMVAGDVLWFSSANGRSRHVVMYAGNSMCVHAKGTAFGTVYEPLDKILNGTSKTLRFCFRPSKNVSCTWRPAENLY